METVAKKAAKTALTRFDETEPEWVPRVVLAGQAEYDRDPWRLARTRAALAWIADGRTDDVAAFAKTQVDPPDARRPWARSHPRRENMGRWLARAQRREAAEVYTDVRAFLMSPLEQPRFTG